MIFGVGGIFVIWVVLMVAGLLIMAIWNGRSPAYFRNESFAPGWIERHAPDIVEEVRRDS